MAVKMNLHLGRRIGFVVVALASTVAGARAQQSATARGTPIIFSAPSTSDSVSSNLNALRTPAAPFRDLEAELKKPFEVFDANRSDKVLRPSDPNFRPPAPEVNRKHLKEQLNDRAERMFLFMEPDDDDLFKAADTDPYTKKPKTALDRYYDRLDRARTGLTNRTSTTDLFGDKKNSDKDRRDEYGLEKKKPLNPLDEDRTTALRDFRPMTNSSPAGDNFYSDKSKPRTAADFLSYSPEATAERSRFKTETRLEDFKRLLDGPGYGPRENLNPPASVYGETAPRPAYGAAAPTWSTTKPTTTKAASADSFATSAGLVGTPGTPQGLKEFGSVSSLSTPPPPPQQVKPVLPPTFTIPKRRF